MEFTDRFGRPTLPLFKLCQERNLNILASAEFVKRLNVMALSDFGVPIPPEHLHPPAAELIDAATSFDCGSKGHGEFNAPADANRLANMNVPVEARVVSIKARTVQVEFGDDYQFMKTVPRSSLQKLSDETRHRGRSGREGHSGAER